MSIAKQNKEFYTQQNIPEEEIERLNLLGYPNHVSETLLSNFELQNKKVLDIGSGPNTSLAKFVYRRNGKYVPVDIRADVLKEMKLKLKNINIPYHGIVADARQLPFSNNAFDIVHERFVLMNIDANSRKKAIMEAIRVTNESLLLIEYNWRNLNSTDDPKKIERFKNLTFKFFEKTSTDPYMGEKIIDLLKEVSPYLKYSTTSFRRKEDIIHMPELMLLLQSFYQGAKNFKDEDLADEIHKLLEELKTAPIRFEPPEIITVTIRK